MRTRRSGRASIRARIRSSNRSRTSSGIARCAEYVLISVV
jgi:hypothetical protein